jgi:TonB family protein
MNGHDLRWLDGLSVRLIERAARSTPARLSERLQEEWLADLTARTGTLSRMRLALGCWWAASVIAREYAVPGIAAVDSGKAVAYAAPPSGFLSRRTAALLVITCLHLTVIYLLATGMEHRAAPALPPPMISDFKQEHVTRQPPPPPIAPRFSPQVIKVIDPDVRIESPPDASGLQRTPVVTPRDPYTPPPPKVDRVMGGPGKGFPDTADYYPDASRRLGEKGVASVRVCVDAAGRLTSDPALAQSSGSARLDGSALKLAKAGDGRYRPSLEDGRAVSSCFPFRIRFEIRD